MKGEEGRRAKNSWKMEGKGRTFLGGHGALAAALSQGSLNIIRATIVKVRDGLLDLWLLHGAKRMPRKST